jgi:hypothetical protein
MINWKKPEFAEAAGLGLFTLVDLERSRGIVSAAAVQAIRRALDSAGVEFSNGDKPGVRLSKGWPQRRPVCSGRGSDQRE